MEPITDKQSMVVSDPPLSFDAFTRVHLAVGTVRTGEPVAGSDKLYRLEVDFGEATPRQVLSGLAQSIALEALIGNQFVFVTNLAERSIMGMMSQAMILATDGPDGLVLASPTQPVPPGVRFH